MMAWRDERLGEAVACGWLTPEQAERLRQATLDDDAFASAIVDEPSTCRSESARLARLGLNLDRPQGSNRDAPDGPIATDGEDVAVRGGEMPEIVADRYHLVRQIGSGGMGLVYEARDLVLARRVAIKFPSQKSIDFESETRLQQERRILADLNDPHLVSVFDAGEIPNGLPYFVMRYVEGENIASFVKRVSYSRAAILRLMVIVSRAVGVAHREAGVIHRDLKPAHILIPADGSPVIIDFGLSKAIRRPMNAPQSDIATPDNRNSTMLGTAGYMAPELMTNSVITSGCDTYALGVILHELLTGTKPLVLTGTRTETGDPVEQAPVVSPKLPSDLAAIIVKCLRPHTADRYFTGLELADDLDLFLSHHPVGAMTVGRRWYVARKFIRRNRARLGIAAIVAVALLATWAEFTRRLSRERDVAREAQARAEAGEQSADQERDRAENLLLKQSIDGATAHLRSGAFDEARLAISRVPKSKWGWECGRLLLESQSAPRASRVIGFHDWGVAALLAGPNAMPLLSAGQDGRIVAWRGESNLQGRPIVEGRWNATLGLWQHAARPFARMDGGPQPEPWTALAWLDNGRAAVASSFSGKIFTVDATLSNARLLLDHGVPVTSVAASHNGATIAFGDAEGSFVLMNQDGKHSESFSIDAGAILDIEVFVDASWIIATENGHVIVRSPDGYRELATIEIEGPVWDLDVGSNEQLAIAHSAESVAVYEWSARNSRLLHVRDYAVADDERGRPSAVHCVRWSPDGLRLAAGDGLGRLIVWEIENGRTYLLATDQKERPLKGERLDSLPLPLRRRTSAILFDSTGDRIWTAGHDSTIKEWKLQSAKGVTSFSTSPRPIAAFDAGGVLWLGGQDGTLRLRRFDSVEDGGTFSGHESSITGLAVAAIANLGVTTDGEVVHFWSRDNEGIEPMASALPAKGFRSLSLSPQGDRLAGLAKNGEVVLWDVPTQSVVARRSLDSEARSVRHGQVAFNASGSQIAAFADSRTLWLLDGHDLSEIGRPYFFGAANGASVAWHPMDPQILAGGNAAGRIQLLPETGMVENTTRYFRDEEVTGIAISPIGNRVAACSASGRIVIVEPNYWGPIYTFQSQHAKSVPLTQITFDTSGQRLVLVHQDGVIEVWDSYPLRAPARDARHLWEKTALLDSHQTKDLLLREQSVALDEQGRVSALYIRATELPVDSKATREIVLGEETDQGFREIILARPGLLDDRGRDLVFRSLALTISGEDRWAAYRRARLDVTSSAGELVLLHQRHDDVTTARESWREEVVGPVGNHGFDVSLFANEKDHRPRIAHYSERNRFFLLEEFDGRAWKSTRHGRQGDGFHLRATLNQDGMLHSIFNPTRYDGDPLAGIYLAAPVPPRAGDAKRLFVDTAPDAPVLSISVDRSGSSLILLKSRDASGVENLLVRQLTENAWTTIASAPTSIATETVSNLATSQKGQIYFAVIDERTAELRLLTVNAGSVHEETVARLSSTRRAASDASWLGPVVRMDNRDNPVIVVGRRSWQDGWLHCWRCTQPK